MFTLNPYQVKVKSLITGDWLVISRSTADLLDLKPGCVVDEAMARRIVQHEQALVHMAMAFAKLNDQRRNMLAARAIKARRKRRDAA